MKLLLDQTFLATEFWELVQKFLIKMFTINAKPSLICFSKIAILVCFYRKHYENHYCLPFSYTGTHVDLLELQKAKF
jgi:hypothetical protein